MINSVLSFQLVNNWLPLHVINFNLSYAYGKGMISQENVNLSFHNESNSVTVMLTNSSIVNP
jgi:hypothetical protein